MAEPAAFVDRDGTLINEEEFLSDPEGVELIPGAVAALAGLRDAGLAIVIVTNQSGIARGFYGEADYRAVQEEVQRQLEAGGVAITAAYFCPHHPEITGPCDCRKPGLGMFRQAAREHDLDLARSVFIGDRLRDVTPGLELGGAAVLVRTGYGEDAAADAPAGVHVSPDLAAAARWYLDSVRR